MNSSLLSSPPKDALQYWCICCPGWQADWLAYPNILIEAADRDIREAVLRNEKMTDRDNVRAGFSTFRMRLKFTMKIIISGGASF